VTTPVQLHVEIEGSGPAVLLTHGYSATAAMWDAQVADLATDHTVIRWDMRGHGRSESPVEVADYAMHHTVADMLRILDEAGAAQAVLVGHSLGGFASLSFATRHLDRVAALVLVDTGPGYRSDKARQGWNDYAEATATRLEKDGLAALSTSPEVRADLHQHVRGLVEAARGALTQQTSEVIDSLPSLAVPALVVVGSEDKPFVDGSRYMAAKLPDASLLVIDGAGHAPMITHPQEFGRGLRDFLDRLP
jgi:pimeloyl-ACP methyl ester carboxylesterase